MTWHCLSTLTWVCLTLSFSFHLIMKLFLHILIYLLKFTLMFMLLWFFWYIFYWLFRKYVGNMCIHMHVSMYLFCIYATHRYVCIYAYMQTCMDVCMFMYMDMCMYLHVCVYVCILCVCICVLSVPIHLHACLCSPTNLSSGCIYIHCHQLVLLSSLSRHFVFSSIFISHLFLLSYCII